MRFFLLEFLDPISQRNHHLKRVIDNFCELVFMPVKEHKLSSVLAFELNKVAYSWAYGVMV